MEGAFKFNEKRISPSSPSGALYHFGTSGISVAVATGLTHPLGSIFIFLIFNLSNLIFLVDCAVAINIVVYLKFFKLDRFFFLKL